MKLNYYRAEIPNFGDDLNPVIFHALFPRLFGEGTGEIDFYGIGSVLDHRVDPARNAVIFGAGVRDFQPPDLSRADIRFVRGPVSARILGIGPDKAICDAAYLLTLLEDFTRLRATPKRYPLALVPYFRHVPFINWRLLERVTGVHVILPTNPDPLAVMTEIAASERVVAGAMHGAIAADMLRIPWRRLQFPSHGYESRLTSELKWLDWQAAMECTAAKPLEIMTNGSGKGVTGRISRAVLFMELCGKLRRMEPDLFSLSLDGVFSRKREQLAAACASFREEYDR